MYGVVAASNCVIVVCEWFSCTELVFSSYCSLPAISTDTITMNLDEIIEATGMYRFEATCHLGVTAVVKAKDAYLFIESVSIQQQMNHQHHQQQQQQQVMTCL